MKRVVLVGGFVNRIQWWQMADGFAQSDWAWLSMAAMRRLWVKPANAFAEEIFDWRKLVDDLGKATANRNETFAMMGDPI